MTTSTTNADAPARTSTLPMTLTLARMAAGPVVAGIVLWAEALFYLDRPFAGYLFIAAAGVFALAALTDWFDGYFARKLGVVSPLGAALDHCADKVLVTCVLVALAMHALPINLVIAAIIILGRDVAVAGLREGLSASGRALPVSSLGKWKAAAEMAGVCAILLEQAALLLYASNEIYLTLAWTARGLIWAAASLAIVSGAIYVNAALKKA